MANNIDEIRCWSGGAGLTKMAIWSVLRMQGFDPHIWFGYNGDVSPVESVPYKRVIWVAQGTITVHLPEQNQEFNLQRGDRLDLPARIPHSTIVRSDEFVCVEARRHVPTARRKDKDLSTKELG